MPSKYPVLPTSEVVRRLEQRAFCNKPVFLWKIFWLYNNKYPMRHSFGGAVLFLLSKITNNYIDSSLFLH